MLNINRKTRFLVRLSLVLPFFLTYLECKPQKIYTSHVRLQKVNCIDTLLIHELEKLAFSDSIDSLIHRHIYPLMGKIKKNNCIIAVLPRHILSESEINNSYYPVEKNELLLDSNVVQVQLIYRDDLKNYKFYLSGEEKIFIIDSEFGRLFNKFFIPQKGYKTFISKSRQYPIKGIEDIDHEIILRDYSPIYVFLYDGEKLYLDPQIDMWDWANG